MRFYKTVDSDNLIRIEDDEGSAVTVLARGNYAIILSLIVPKDNRREGIGTALVDALVRLLLSRGIKKLEVDYSDSIEGFSEFLRENGFSEISAVPVLSVELNALFSKAVVKRFILSEVDGVNYVSLADLSSGQWGDLFDCFNRMRLMIVNADAARLFHDASGVVYDDKGRLEAFVLCSMDEDGSSVHVDFLAGTEEGKPQYIMCAVRGMLMGLLEAGRDRGIQTITMVAANPGVNGLMERTFEDKETVKTTGSAVYAVKELEKIRDETEVADDPDEDMDDEWRREIRHIPFQTNIWLKMPWLRHMDDPAAAEEAYEEGYEDDYEEGYEEAEKDVDETEGLEYNDTIRITSDNLHLFRDDLDDVSVSDLSRYFFRGLAALTDEHPCGVLVYELKHYEEQDDTEAEITYLSIRDEEAGRRLLAEFMSEAEKDSVKRVYFEFEELSELEKDVLRSAGFLMESREGTGILLTLEELRSISVLSKKPKGYIQSVKSLSNKQLRLAFNSCLFRNRKGTLEDFGMLPIDWFERDISSCVVSDGRVTGLFLMHLRGDNCLSLDLLYAADVEYQADLLYMLRFSLAAALKKYPAKTKAFVWRHNKEVWNLAGKLLPGRSGRTVLAGEKKV